VREKKRAIGSRGKGAKEAEIQNCWKKKTPMNTMPLKSRKQKRTQLQ